MADNWPRIPAFNSPDEVGCQLPEGWQLMQIESLYEQLPIGKRYDKKTSITFGLVPIIDQSRDGILGWHDDEPGIVASEERPVVTFANHTCEMRWMTRPFSVIQNVFPLVGKSGVCETRFLYYGTKGRVWLEEYKGHFPDYRRKWIAVPPLEEQRAIAHILGTLDDKIELNRRQNETLEAMARTLFKAWFVDFEPVRAKMEGRWQRGQSLPGLPAHLYDLFPDRLVESELGEIPEGWEVKSFADTVEIIGGGTPKTSVAEYWGGDIPWFSVVDAPPAPDVWVLDTEKKITHAGVENSSTRILPVGTTIISARGTVGRLALVGVPMAMNQSCYGLRGKLGHRGFFNYFTTRQLVSTLQHRTHGSVFDTITRDTLAGAQVVAPPLAVVETFERLVAPALDRIREALFESRSLATKRNTLLPKLISGDVRVGAIHRNYLEGVKT